MIRSGKKEKWIIYMLAVLLCLVLASFWLMCNIYARYTSGASGSDEARVAKFSITETGEATQQIKVDVYPGFGTKSDNEGKYKVSVTNNSEVTIDYVMEIKNTYGNLPLQFQMLDASGNEISNKRAEISAGDQTEHVYTLNISWPTGNTEENNTSAQSPDYAGKTDVIEITLKAVQKD